MNPLTQLLDEATPLLLLHCLLKVLKGIISLLLLLLTNNALLIIIHLCTEKRTTVCSRSGEFCSAYPSVLSSFLSSHHMQTLFIWNTWLCWIWLAGLVQRLQWNRPHIAIPTYLPLQTDSSKCTKEQTQILFRLAPSSCPFSYVLDVYCTYVDYYPSKCVGQ